MRKNENHNKVSYILSGPLNRTLRNKLKRKRSRILNSSNTIRNLSRLMITKSNSDDTQHVLKQIQKVKPDLKLPAVQLFYVANYATFNILENPNKGTYISKKNRAAHFHNIGKSIHHSRKNVHFLRKGAGAILINNLIKEMRNAGIKTIFVHPSNRTLEEYYTKFGFKIIENVRRNNNRLKYENYGEGHMMYLEL